jgi:hypothetical protein
VLAEHADLTSGIHADAAWARAAADYAAAADRPVRLVTLTDATTTGGRSRAQASAQLARSARSGTSDRVSAFAVSLETAGTSGALGELAAHLICAVDAPALSGAELAAGDGWFGVRSHPRPLGSITFGEGDVPDWFDGLLADIVRGADGPLEEVAR